MDEDPGFRRDDDVYGMVSERYAIAVSDHLLDRIGGDTDGPLARQYLPDIRELDTTPAERADPIGDAAHSPVKGIVHRYPNRALLMPLEVCAVYCRFCFRREKVGQDGHGLLSQSDLDAALAYIRATPALREIILTGGDPLVLSPRRLSGLLQALNAIEHVKIIRIHSRLPVADPTRVTEDLCAAISCSKKPVYIVVHANHADELCEQADEALRMLRRAGAILLSQSVLLKGVNDNADALAALFQGLAERGVKPYYLHHPDLAPGTAHFRLAPETGQALMRAVRGRVSGLAMPIYVLDIPGGHGKVPLGLSALVCGDAGVYKVTDNTGIVHDYDPGLPA